MVDGERTYSQSKKGVTNDSSAGDVALLSVMPFVLQEIEPQLFLSDNNFAQWCDDDWFH